MFELVLNATHESPKCLCLAFFFFLLFDRSGKDFDIVSQRVAASNSYLKDAFVEALQQSE